MLCRIPRTRVAPAVCCFFRFTHTFAFASATIRFAVNTAHASLWRGSRCLSLRMVYLFVKFSTRCWIIECSLLLCIALGPHHRHCILGWGQWQGVKYFCLPKYKFYFDSPDSVRSPQTDLCCEYFSRRANSASISHVLFDCTWYVRIFAGLRELNKERILFVQ